MSDEALEKVRELAEQTVAYVQRAVGVALEYDSDTLPILDHYLRGVPADRVEILELVIVTAGAYFGEVVRRHIGGRWELEEEPRRWHFVLPSALRFCPAGLVAAAIAGAELEDVDTVIDAPPRIRPHVQEALQRMGHISHEEYYSLGGRYDTLEHLHEVLVSAAAAALGDAGAEAVPEQEPSDAADDATADDLADHGETADDASETLTN